ncbi:MAG: shikimate kinase, partial [Hyphomonadaceae bacterium]|nr:shikimate kinase [Hyphomonadaceae bacterium]
IAVYSGASSRNGVEQEENVNGAGAVEPTGEVQALAAGLIVDRPIVLVGLMGAGKTTIGRRLAAVLNLPFVDADEEIERAAGLPVSEIFARHGEPEFRRGERAVIARLLQGGPHVLATGGGAFMDPETRALVRERAVSVWLRADIEVLMRRVEKRDTRPLLRGDNPRAVMERLMAERHPIYAEADVTVDSNNLPHGAAVTQVLQALHARAQGGQA